MAPQAIWLEFVGAYRVACFDLYLFFEGKDDFSFYQPYLRQVWSNKGSLHGFNCQGKADVIQIMPKVKQKLDYPWRGLFFTDKDVDDYCGERLARGPVLVRDRVLFDSEFRCFRKDIGDYLD